LNEAATYRGNIYRYTIQICNDENRETGERVELFSGSVDG
jgi:hypothetical protein